MHHISNGHFTKLIDNENVRIKITLNAKMLDTFYENCASSVLCPIHTVYNMFTQTLISKCVNVLSVKCVKIAT